MTPARPIGHLVANLAIVAITISHVVKFAPTGATHVCWRNDDGCLFLQRTDHPEARAIERHAPHQVINRYRKQPAFGWKDIASDLETARLEFATQALAEAHAA